MRQPEVIILQFVLNLLLYRIHFIVEIMVTVRMFCHGTGEVIYDVGYDDNDGAQYQGNGYRGRRSGGHATTKTSRQFIVTMRGSKAGFLVSVSNGFITNYDWKCGDIWESYWATPYFDDSDWQNAVELGSNVDRPRGWKYRKDFSRNAQWVWSKEGIPASTNTSWCRGVLGRTCTQDIQIINVS